jgi:hypothetical protein
MPRHAEDPATRRASCRIESGGTSPYLDKDIVHDVFGQGVIASDSLGNPQKSITFLLIQIPQCLLLASGASHQAGFIVKTGLW